MAQIHRGPMAGRTVLVTGGTGGIGRATALGLAAMGAHVAITGRDRGRTEDAAREIRAAGGGQVDVFVADLSSQSEVRRLADEVLQTPSPDRCAGQQRRRVLEHPARHRRRARAHLRPQPSRAVPAHQPAPRPAEAERPGPRGHGRPPTRTAMGRIDFDDLQGERSYSGARAYNQSKLANVLFTYELARQAAGHRRHRQRAASRRGAAPRSEPRTPAGVQRLFVPFMRPFMKTPAQGAATSIHLASAPDLEQVTGRYFADSKPKRSSKRSYDEAAAARLWQVSADLVGLTAPAATS